MEVWAVDGVEGKGVRGCDLRDWDDVVVERLCGCCAVSSGRKDSAWSDGRCVYWERTCSAVIVLGRKFSCTIMHASFFCVPPSRSDLARIAAPGRYESVNTS